MQTRPTWVRRSTAALAAGLIVFFGGVRALRPDIEDCSPLHLALGLGALVFLLALSAYEALRPLHRPALPPWKSGALIALTLASTFVLALIPPHHGPVDGAPLLAHVTPCLFTGLLLGLPVYLLLRLLDRGSGAGALLAACAAGLAGDLALQLRCPRTDLEHLMLGHFLVALLFVGGLAAIRRLIRPRE
jgi:hypothetical protein